MVSYKTDETVADMAAAADLERTAFHQIDTAVMYDSLWDNIGIIWEYINIAGTTSFEIDRNILEGAQKYEAEMLKKLSAEDLKNTKIVFLKNKKILVNS